MIQVRWLHSAPEDQFGRYVPSRDQRGRLQQLSRPTRASDIPYDLNWQMHEPDNPLNPGKSSVEMRKVQDLRTGSKENPRATMIGRQDEMKKDPGLIDAYYRYREASGGMANLEGYFGESFVHRRACLQTHNLYAVRDISMDGVHTCDGKVRTIRDLVSQLWFDDWDEATCGACGLCDLTVPSHPQAAMNREVIGATPTVMQGLERLVRSGSPNAAYNACEALSQLAFRNRHNGARIMACSSPCLRRGLDEIFALNTAAMDDDSKYDLRAAVLRVFNNCCWNSRQTCIEIAEDEPILSHVEDILQKGSKLQWEGTVPLPALIALDAAVGLLNHLSTDEHCRQILIKRQTAQKVLLPIVSDAEKLINPPEQYLCTVAGAVEVIINLIWNAETPPFIPHHAVLQTIIWTLICALDGVTWAGITWSTLGRLQALSQFSALDALKIPLIELNLVEVLARLLNQWTSEQGTLGLELALMTLLNLLSEEEGRWRMYRLGVFQPFRNIIMGMEGVTDCARERAVLCAWMLFEWQVNKLDVLDRKAKELMNSLEDSERNRLELEDEYARVRAVLHEDLTIVTGEKSTFHERYEIMLSELDAAQRALQTERIERNTEMEVASSLIASMDGTIEQLRAELGAIQRQLLTWQSRAVLAEQELSELQLDSKDILIQRDNALNHRNNALELASLEHEDFQAEKSARRKVENEVEVERSERQALVSARNVLLAANEELRRLLTTQQEENVNLREDMLARQSKVGAGQDGNLLEDTNRLLDEYRSREKVMAAHIRRLQVQCETSSNQQTPRSAHRLESHNAVKKGEAVPNQAGQWWSLGSWLGTTSHSQSGDSSADPLHTKSSTSLYRQHLGRDSSQRISPQVASQLVSKKCRAEVPSSEPAASSPDEGGQGPSRYVLTYTERDRLQRLFGQAKFEGLSKTRPLSLRNPRSSQNPEGE